MERTIEAPSLLGDSIYSSYFIARYAELHPDEQVTVVVPENRWSIQLYRYIPGVCGVRVKLPSEQADIRIDLGVAFGLDTSRYGGQKPFWHCISESLGLNTEDIPSPPILLPQSRLMLRPHSPVLCVPYSVSCSSRDGKGMPPNKMLSWDHWQAARDVIDSTLPTTGLSLFVGGKDEEMPEWIPEGEKLVGASFDFLLWVLAGARGVVAVDNGMVRLAALLNVPVFFTKPAGLGQMFIPTWGDRVTHEYGHPATYTVGQFRGHVHQFVRSLL